MFRSILFVSTIFVAAVSAAGVFPITENPVPQWASSSDVCKAINSCDGCAIKPNLSYCFYTDEGQATCCNKATGNVVDKPLVASVGPIEEDPVPEWASKSDSCNAISTCDKCSIKKGSSYCFYTEQGQATCCARTGAASPVAEKADKPLVASVGPIEEDPVPEWASKSDSCSIVKTCDKCPVKKGSTYCFYTEDGIASCCKRSSSPLNKMNKPSPVLSASVGPIEENPIPSWASDSDVCKRKKSCDHCKNSQYCKYTESGIPQCCRAADKQKPNKQNDKPLVASVGPIEENPVPEWASKSDSCAAINTCDKCSVNKGLSYCFYTEEGQATCCNRQGATSPAADNDKPLVASVGPIEEDPVPEWASKSDSCSAIKTCDKCSVQKGQSYCFYTEEGQATCCNRSVSPASPATSGAISASVGPIEENPIPSWAAATDMCLAIKSCDYCNNPGKAYCKYTDEGQSMCCSRSN